MLIKLRILICKLVCKILKVHESALTICCTSQMMDDIEKLRKKIGVKTFNEPVYWKGESK